MLVSNADTEKANEDYINLEKMIKFLQTHCFTVASTPTTR